MNSKYTIAIVVGILIIGGGIYLLTRKSSSNPSPTSSQVGNEVPVSKTPSPQPVPAPVVIHNISISNFAFIPSTITVRKGETIVWTNDDSTAHTVTGGDLQSPLLAQNQTYSFAFDKTGTFTYHCSIHPSMKGTIIVTD